MPRTILIYRLGSIGDAIVALPCFHAIARAFPGHRRVLLTNVPVSKATSSIAEVLGDSGLVHDVIAYPVRTRSLSALLKLRYKIMGIKADRLIYLMPERSDFSVRRDLLFFRHCGLSEVIGADVSARKLRVVDALTGEVERECLRIARSLSVIGPVDLNAPENWDLLLTSGERASSYEMLPGGPFVAINMGGKVARNDWGIDRWMAMLKAVSQGRPSLGLIVVGGASDHGRADLACRGWIGPTRNLCGLLSVRQTAAALERAVLFVGHDSGPMHLAQAVGVHIIALFGNNNPPKKWHPMGPYHVCLHDMRGVEHITTAAVLSCIEQQLIESQIPRQ